MKSLPLIGLCSKLYHVLVHVVLRHSPKFQGPADLRRPTVSIHVKIDLIFDRKSLLGPIWPTCREISGDHYKIPRVVLDTIERMPLKFSKKVDSFRSYDIERVKFNELIGKKRRENFLLQTPTTLVFTGRGLIFLWGFQAKCTIFFSS